jgi:hypothetical protein
MAKPLMGVNYSSAFISGNVFSLDGIHATPRGSIIAIIANANIPLVIKGHQFKIQCKRTIGNRKRL